MLVLSHSMPKVLRIITMGTMKIIMSELPLNLFLAVLSDREEMILM